MWVIDRIADAISARVATGLLGDREIARLASENEHLRRSVAALERKVDDLQEKRVDAWKWVAIHGRQDAVEKHQSPQKREPVEEDREPEEDEGISTVIAESAAKWGARFMGSPEPSSGYVYPDAMPDQISQQ